MTEPEPLFLKDRRNFLKLGMVKTESGWDVVLRIDGTYASRYLAMEAAQSLRDQIVQEVPGFKMQRVWRMGDLSATEHYSLEG